MARFFTALLFCSAAWIARADPQAWLPIEKQVAEAAQSNDVTVVHFWASWCPNCKAELKDDGWSTFIDTNAEVKFIFISTWHNEDGRALLEQYNVGKQPNFTLLHYPNHSRKRAERMITFMDLPVSWIPTTWVFKGGQLRYALNYGEVHFPILQQLIRDSSDKWSHAKPAAAPVSGAAPAAVNAPSPAPSAP